MPDDRASHPSSTGGMTPGPRFVPRGRHLFLYDLAAISIAIVGAFALRFDANNVPAEMRPYLPVAFLPLFVQPVVNVIFGLYRREWRYASVREMIGITAAVGTGTVVSGVLFLILAAADAPSTTGMPRSFFVLEGLLSLILIGGGRFTLRWALENAGRSGETEEETAGARTLVYGAGEAGAAVARLSDRDPAMRLRIVGFLDDDDTKRGSRLLGVRIFGDLAKLGEVARRTHATQLVVAMPSAPGSIIRKAVDAGQELGLDVRIVPPLHQLLAGDERITRLRPVVLDDLLRREPVRADLEELADYLNGASVLITGGGGSIGSELARQIHALGPRHLTVADNSEVALWGVEQSLRSPGQTGGPTVSTVLCDVRSSSAVRRLVDAAQPDVVFHAAALKHVPICELQPAEACLTNVVGTRNVLEACERSAVGRFVLISTDKAVMPVSVMGATKRLAELLTIESAARVGRPYIAVRFGNVLGSSGSVVPIFQHQLSQGQPLTITHPDATRYFMTIPEAVTLILQAASEPDSGEVYILDMGEPVRIMDLATDIIRLSGADPDAVDIVFTGLRPGERLHETLFFDHETVDGTSHERIWRARSSPRESITEPASRIVERLQVPTADSDDRAARELLLRSGVLLHPEPTVVSVG